MLAFKEPAVPADGCMTAEGEDRAATVRMKIRRCSCTSALQEKLVEGSVPEELGLRTRWVPETWVPEGNQVPHVRCSTRDGGGVRMLVAGLSACPGETVE